MNRLITLLFVLFTLPAAAQKDYFVYIQADAEQPFFIRLQERNYASTSNGYLILPRLRDSVYNLAIGFPGGKWPEQRFSVRIAGRDRGFLLKQFEGSGWGLFDMQTLAVIQAEKREEEVNPKPVSNEKVSAFTDVLAKAANDPSLRERKTAPAAVPKETPKKPAVDSAVAITKSAEKIITEPEEKPVPAVTDTGYVGETVIIQRDTLLVERKTKEGIATAAKDTMVVEKISVSIRTEEPEPDQPLPGPEKRDSVMTMPAIDDKALGKTNQITEPMVKVSNPVALVPSKLTRRSESSTSEGFGLVYTDQYADGHIDTIRILIPNQRNLLRSDERPGDKRFLEDISSQGGDSVKTEKTATSTCTVTASENDFLQLRKKMAAQKADDAMIAEARKAFKVKCYTVKHIRNLGVLFLNDAARFQFYEAAYPRVADPAAFESLGSELKNEYYNRRFQALLGG